MNRAQRRAAESAARSCKSVQDAERLVGAIGSAFIDAGTSTVGMSATDIGTHVASWIEAGGCASLGSGRLMVTAVPLSLEKPSMGLANVVDFDKTIGVLVFPLKDHLAKMRNDGGSATADFIEAHTTGQIVMLAYDGNHPGGFEIFDSFARPYASTA